MSRSVASVDDIFNEDVPEDVSVTESWKQDLNDRVERLIDRKKSSAEGRESALAAYCFYTMNRYAYDEIQSRTSELFPALLKIVKNETSEKETCLALRGMCCIASEREKS